MSTSTRLLITALAVMAPITASAQTTFYEAYELGRTHEQAGRWRRARSAYLAAIQFHPEPEKRIKTYGLNFLHDYDPYLRLARIELELGMLDEADTHLDRSAAAGVSPEEDIAVVRIGIQRERARRRASAAPSPTPPPMMASPTEAPQPTPTPIPTILEIASDPAGAEVYIDGLRLGISPVSIPVEPGRHRIELRLEGHRTHREDRRVEAGTTVKISTRLTRRSATPTPGRTQPTPIPTSPLPTVAAVAAAEPTVSSTEPPATPTAPVSEIPSEQPTGVPRGIVFGVVAVVFAVPAVIVLLLFVRTRRLRDRAPSVHTLTPTRRMDTTPSKISRTTPLPDGTNPVFGSYRLQSVLGHGGMATTYLAERTRDGESVALKIPHEHLLSEPEFVERFIREGALGATIHHPNIVRIHEADQVGQRPFIAMELLRGVTLRDFLHDEAPLALRPSLEITRGIALALDYAHVKGIVHRDLKPDNVMMLTDGSVKVMDFGIARIADAPGLTGSNAYIGTPLYSAPECLTPTQVDQRTDLYSLGIIFYAMLMGRPPFQADSPLKLLEMHRDDTLPTIHASLDVPVTVVAIIERLTAKRKEDRYPSAEVLLAELNGVLNEL